MNLNAYERGYQAAVTEYHPTDPLEDLQHALRFARRRLQGEYATGYEKAICELIQTKLDKSLFDLFRADGQFSTRLRRLIHP